MSVLIDPHLHGMYTAGKQKRDGCIFLGLSVPIQMVNQFQSSLSSPISFLSTAVDSFPLPHINVDFPTELSGPESFHFMNRNSLSDNLIVKNCELLFL